MLPEEPDDAAAVETAVVVPSPVEPAAVESEVDPPEAEADAVPPEEEPLAGLSAPFDSGSPELLAPVEPDPLAWVVPETPYRTPSIMTYGVAEIESVGGVPATPNVTPSIIRDGVPGAGSVVEAPDVAIDVEPVVVLEVVPPAVATEALLVAGPLATEPAEPALDPLGRLSAPWATKTPEPLAPLPAEP